MNNTIVIYKNVTDRDHVYGYDNIIFLMIFLSFLIYSLKYCCKKCNNVYIGYIKKLPEIKYKRIHSTDDICTICIENLETNERVIKLKCEHMFHPKCINQWINIHERCPNCNLDVYNNDIESNLLHN